MYERRPTWTNTISLLNYSTLCHTYHIPRGIFLKGQKGGVSFQKRDRDNNNIEEGAELKWQISCLFPQDFGVCNH